MEKLAVGVDFGGTKIASGVVDLKTGKIVGLGKKKTRSLADQGDVVRRLIATIDEALEQAEISIDKIGGIGIGAAGMVDRGKGILLVGTNIGVNDIPLAEPISQYYGVPCRIGNDVEAATHAELNFGAGRDCDNFVCVFVGTGIGSGIVNSGVVHFGATQTAGEIGHTIVVPDGKQCGCGATGCLEAYASRSAIAKAILYDIEHGAKSSIADKIDMSRGILRAKAIANAVSEGDELVIATVTNAANFLGIALANVINFYNPRRLILGGGLIEATDLYYKIAEKEARRLALKIPAAQVEIVRAALGDYAGIIGAALLAKPA
jgi:glucokinase